MNKDKLSDFLKQKNIVVPLAYFQKYKEMNLSIEEFIFLMYLKDKGDIFSFDPTEMEKDLGYSMIEIMGFISNLTDKKILSVDTFKNEHGVMEERINLSGFYEKYTSLLLEEWNQSKENAAVMNYNLFEDIEKEFGRTLSPSEIEFIKAWLSNFNEGVILEAVKEATLNGVSSIRYIDKILYDWDKKGIKNKEDVLHMLQNRKKEVSDPVEVFEYDWFDEDEEE